MKRLISAVLLGGCLSTHAIAAQSAAPVSTSLGDFFSRVRAAIERNLGRPYVWGATGIKSYDCSGFLWRVLYENGILMKRTTARKFYMMMKPAEKNEQWKFGTVVFFDHMKHVGIIDDQNAFFHAQTSAGTKRSPMNSFWRNRICGFRKLPTPRQFGDRPQLGVTSSVAVTSPNG